MLAVLSPSKTQDFEDDLHWDEATQPLLINESKKLVAELRKLSVPRLQTLMGVSKKLAELNHDRFQQFSTPFNKRNARQALLAFRGDVYDDIDVGSYGKREFAFAQRSLRILSGLYGVLRPLDLIQPYRLEMKTKLSTKKGSDLYQFWGSKLRKQIEEAVEASGSEWLINLASNEYFKALEPKKLGVPVVTVDFKEKKGSDLRTVALFAKRARGSMADFIIKNRLRKPEELSSFNRDGYRFLKSASSEERLVFVRSAR